MASSDDVKVITFWASPYGLRAEFALAAKGVPYERLLEVDHWFHKSQLLLESNPIHKQIPVLLHHGKPLPESFLIIEYVDEVWPSPDGRKADLLPHDPYERAMARFWADFVEKKLGSALRTVLLTKGDVQKAAVEEALSHVATLEAVLMKTAAEGRPYFGGEHVGMVDIVLGALSLWFPAYEVIGDFKFPWEEKFPRLHAWSQAFKASKCAKCFPDPHKLKEFVLGLRSRLEPSN